MNKHPAQHGVRRRAVAALAAALAAGAGAFAMIPAAAQAAAPSHRTATAGGYAFTTLDNQADPTFNQLLGINSQNVISGYFGSGAKGHPNKGYLLSLPYQQSNYVSENFPGSAQTQVTALNNKGDTAGFWVNGKLTNRDFVEWNGEFASYSDPKTPHVAGAVNQLLGINDAGIAVGFYNDKNGNSHAYTLNQATGKFTAIRIVPGRSVTASGINNKGDIVGFATSGSGSAATTSSWLLHNKHLRALQFPGGSDTQALGINDKDQIVGSYDDSSGVMHGFLLSTPLTHAKWVSIDDPNGVGSTVINGLNNATDMVGFYTDSSGNTDGMLILP
jgi:hypothetical protein